MSGDPDPLDLPPGGPLAALRRFTPARIGLGRAGPALPTRELLRLGLAHARARDAVHAALDAPGLEAALRALDHAPRLVRSAAPDRATYLLRPDLGRRLDAASAAALAPAPDPPPPVAVVLADGLSAIAVVRHAPPLLAALAARASERWTGVPVVIALQARVALGDEVGARLGARLVAVLVGERPGLSSPDSLGVYLTLAPQPGRTDAERSCVSNVRPEGLGYAEAAERIDGIVAAGLAGGTTGVAHLGGSAASPALPR
ncbi:ethanolamine ammonia-lyase subunit EutC [Anaeromyxobacter oryzae]|uniref:Ethanolamine ammonia-lyase small subunit n=1 Tax=Anaeromyxobacter oryzae TaxID=2918170 RepID=A0ABN6MN83_9BACT|nr:ethanolamine ammonia-lyase subunit EutC [Anaeromyxobacter oryzae]BDG01065.1 ethanolamine ammonia-lyase light chain [Anaeromyxobacter oryzae]